MSDHSFITFDLCIKSKRTAPRSIRVNKTMKNVNLHELAHDFQTMLNDGMNVNTGNLNPLHDKHNETVAKGLVKHASERQIRLKDDNWKSLAHG